MKATLSIAPLYDTGGTGDVLKTIEVEFSDNNADDAVTDLGAGIVETVLASQQEDPSITAFDLTLEIKVEREDRPRRFIVEETIIHEVVAKSQDEAEAIWLDKGDEAGDFIAVTERDIYEKDV